MSDPSTDPVRGRRWNIAWGVLGTVLLAATAWSWIQPTLAADTPAFEDFPEQPRVPHEQMLDELAESPFAGIWADSFLPPDDVVHPPLPKATPHWSRDEVADMLGTVRDTLLAARVDWPLGTVDAEDLTGRFAPDARGAVEDTLASPDRLDLVTALADGATVRPVVVVEGAMDYAEATVDGLARFRVAFNYTWVYVFDGEQEHYGDRVFAVQESGRWEFRDPGEVASTSEGLWPVDAESWTQNTACSPMVDGFLAPPGDDAVPEDEYLDPDLTFFDAVSRCD